MVYKIKEDSDFTFKLDARENLTTKKKISETIKRLKKEAASGVLVNIISVSFVYSDISESIVIIIKNCFNIGISPDHYKKGCTNFQKRSKTEIINYKAISLIMNLAI